MNWGAATSPLKLATAGVLTSGAAALPLTHARAPIAVFAERVGETLGRLADRFLHLEPWYVVPAAAALLAYPNPLIWPAVALIVLPLVHPSGHVLGTFCCIQPTAREWTDRDMTIMRELTESIMTEILLREQITKLKAQQQVRETFVAALTHDMRTPLMTAKVSMELLRRGPGDAQGIEVAASRVTRNIDRADRSRRDLRDAFRIEAGLGVGILSDTCDLHAITLQTLEELSAIYPDRFRLQAAGDFTLQADRDALQRVIENLASNAAKYGAPDTAIEVSLERSLGGVTLRVTNQGNPIPEAQLQSIFEPFQRANVGANSGVKGWGLGLGLVRGFVEAHGGTVTVTSAAAAGTTFTVSLPLRRASAATDTARPLPS